LLILNLLLVFLPIATILYLDTYEKQLLDSLEHALVQQGRFLAAALKDNELNGERSGELLFNLNRQHDARIRVIRNDGTLLADSSTLLPPVREQVSSDKYASFRIEEGSAEDTLLYRIASFPIRVFRRYFNPPDVPRQGEVYYSENDFLSGVEVQTALSGRYGSTTRLSSGGQVSVTLYSAIPVWKGGEVSGVVLVNQSTFRILKDIYTLRLDIFKVFLISLSAALLISFFLSWTISRPIKRLHQQAVEILDRKGRILEHFTTLNTPGELGDLSRALENLTNRVQKYTNYMESFSSDLSHEIKNPVASIRSASEVALTLDNGEEKNRFLRRIIDETVRIERLVDNLRILSRMDSASETEQNLVIAEVLDVMVQNLREQNEVPLEILTSLKGDELVKINPEGFHRLLINIVENARSYSPPGKAVTLKLTTENGFLVLQVSDRGPGFDPSILNRVFERFFSYRPKGSKQAHSGLGLAIVKGITERAGGTTGAWNRPEGGAVICIRLPLRG
jgi:two-component system sensor histidine kinase ChvG